MSDRTANLPRVRKETPGKPMTRQSFKEECDVNTIMGKFRETGFVDHIQVYKPVYEDFSNAVDYQTALNQVRAAQELFESLPARVRARVENDPGKFIEFAENDENAEELAELGLKNPITTRPPKPPPAAEPEPESTPEGGETPS